MTDPRLDDTHDLSGTQPMRPVEQRAVAGKSKDARRATSETPRKRKRDERGSSPFYLPAWSVGLMLLMVFGIAGGIVTLVLMLGGQSAPGGDPRVIIITAVPSPTSDQPPTATGNPVTIQDANSAGTVPLPTFALEGPTLPPIILSPTPLSITMGSPVIVNAEGLNVRPEPGLDNTPLFNAALGEGFNIVGGPLQAAGLTWWEIQSPDDPSRRGWAAADYLDVFAP